MASASIKHPDKDKLPSEVYADLVETLFGTVGSFVAGMVGGFLVAIIAWFRTYDPIFLVCLGVILALSIFRVAVLVAHNRTEEAERRAEARRWERLYAIGGVGFMAAVGVTAAILFYGHTDELSGFYSIVTALGFAGALAGRNAGRPIIVFSQVLGVCAPLTVVMFLHQDAWYWGLAALLCLVMISVKSTTKFLNRMLVSALLNGREAKIQRARFGTALNSMSHGLCMGDKDGLVTVMNHRLEEFFGLDHETGGLSLRDLAERIADSGAMPPQARTEFVHTWDTHVAQRDSGVFSDTIGGRIYDFRCEPMEKGGCVVVVEDVTDARIASREVEHMARFDTLTGLPNRALFHSRLVTLMDQPLASGEQLALISVDLDRFKEVNDTLGHPMGDKLLRLVADRLCLGVREEDFVARFGGDEFQILLQPSAELPDVDAIAKRLIENLSERYIVDGHTITIGASIGIAFAPGDASSPDELLRCADMALYHAKGAGRGIYRRFTPDMDAAAHRKRQVEQDLRVAIANENLELHYQPIVDTRINQIVACEALVRWRHPVNGMIPPGEFIQIAEETGLIVEIGDWVLRRACADALSWPDHVRVAVNISAKQFVLASNLVGDIQGVLTEFGLPPDRLEVEITESTLVESREAVAQLGELFKAGVRLSLDDFGTGYSSLSYLRQFPVHKIKIDRSFVHNLAERASQAVIGSVAFLAELLDVELVMEGVETELQLKAVTDRNVHLVQGYYFSRPKPLAELLPMFTTEVLPSASELRNVA